MKKFIKKFNEVISSPLFKIVFPIIGFPFLIIYISGDFHYQSASFGAMVWFSLDLFCDGIDGLIEKKKKAEADRENQE